MLWKKHQNVVSNFNFPSTKYRHHPIEKETEKGKKDRKEENFVAEESHDCFDLLFPKQK